MKKKLAAILIVILSVCLAFSFAYADEEKLPLLIDDADILSDEAESDILLRLSDISDRYNCDTALLIISDTYDFGYDDGTALADDFYDYSGYGRTSERDGMLLVWVDNDRELFLSTRGYVTYAVTDTGLDYIFDEMSSYLYDNDFYGAFVKYAESIDYLLELAKSGNRMTSGETSSAPNPLLKIPIALAIGILIAFIIVSSWKSQLKSVQAEKFANNYVKEDTIDIRNGGEYFMYSHVDKTKKAKQESTTHTSSSGATHGGGSKKF